MPRLGATKTILRHVRRRMDAALVRDLQSRRVVEVAEREEKQEVGPVTLDDLWIQDKDGREWCLGEKLNEPQTIWLREVFGTDWRTANPGLDLRRGKLRSITLKARQEGITTLVMAVFVCNAANRTNFNALFFADTKEKTEDAFKRVNFFHERLPLEKRPIRKGGTSKVLDYTMLRSRIRIATAGSRDVGRSGTLQAVHWSEVAFAPDAARMGPGLFNSVPPTGTIILESTAEGDGAKDDGSDEYLGGRGAFFAYEWKESVAGNNGFHPIFLPWHAMAEYRSPVPEGFRRTRAADEKAEETRLRFDYGRFGDEEAVAARFGVDDEQLAFRRMKIAEPGMSASKFAQEYPGDWEEALAAGSSFMFPEFIEDVHTAVPFDVPTHCTAFGGFDWGFADPASFGLYRTLDDRRIAKVREFYGPGKTDPEIAAEILSLIAAEGLEPSQVPIYTDPMLWHEDRAHSVAGAMPPRRVDAYIAAGLCMVKASNGRLNGWANLREYLKQMRLVIFRGRCPATIRTLKNLPKHPVRREDSDNRQGAGVEDHAADETRYALMSWPLLGRPETEQERFEREEAMRQKQAREWREKEGLERKSDGDFYDEVF
jgi:hypothetical protein